MAERPEDANLQRPEAMERIGKKEGRKRKKRPGAKRTSKMKREKSRLSRGEPPASKIADELAGGSVADKAGGGTKERKVKDNDKELENRVFVSGLPSATDEQLLLEHFGSCGPIRSVKLIRNSRLVFRGSCFLSFKKASSVQAALDLDGTTLQEQVIQVKMAAVPVAAPDLKVYVAGLPWKATEEVLQKDFGECGEIAKLNTLKDPKSGKFRGVMFVTFKSQAGVDAALKYHDTDYGGHMLCVRLASAKPSEVEAPFRKRGPSAMDEGNNGAQEPNALDAAEGDATSGGEKIKVAKKVKKRTSQVTIASIAAEK